MSVLCVDIGIMVAREVARAQARDGRCQTVCIPQIAAGSPLTQAGVRLDLYAPSRGQYSGCGLAAGGRQLSHLRWCFALQESATGRLIICTQVVRFSSCV
jgi:hypothetical protein